MNKDLLFVFFINLSYLLLLGFHLLIKIFNLSS